MSGELNWLATQTRFCQRCGSPRVEVDGPRSLRCPDCGLSVFFNPKPVAGVVLREDDGRIWLMRRGLEPGAGLWTFAGGFVDLGETVEQAARREAMEELGVDVELGELLGVYSSAEDPIVLVVWLGRALGTPRVSEEAVEVRPFAPGEVPWDEIAFWSTTAALRDAIARTAVTGAG